MEAHHRGTLAWMMADTGSMRTRKDAKGIGNKQQNASTANKQSVMR
jgi:hypothetical protein